MGNENARYVETMTSLKFQERCEEVDQLWAQDYIEHRLQQADVRHSQVTVYFQQYVPRTHPLAQERLQNVISFLGSGHFPRWVGGNIVGPEHDDRGCLDLLDSRNISSQLSECKRCRWSVHAGELRCKNRNVLEAIKKFNASRIGHGINWFDDGQIMAETLRGLRARDILIESKLISNKALAILKRSQDHPLPRFLEENIATCLSSDDSAMWGSTLTDEYMLAADLLPEESLLPAFIQMGLNSLNYAFAPEHIKKNLVRQYWERAEQFYASCLTANPEKSCFETRQPMSVFACTQWPDLCLMDRGNEQNLARKAYQEWCQGPFLQREKISTPKILSDVAKRLEAVNFPAGQVCLAEALSIKGAREQDAARLLSEICHNMEPGDKPVQHTACGLLEMDHGYGLAALPHAKLAVQFACHELPSKDAYICARSRTLLSVVLRSAGQMEFATSNASIVAVDEAQPYLLRLEALNEWARASFYSVGPFAATEIFQSFVKFLSRQVLDSYHSVSLPAIAAVTFRRYAELLSETGVVTVDHMADTAQRAVYFAAIQADPMISAKAELTEAKVHIENRMNLNKAKYLMEQGCSKMPTILPRPTHPAHYRCYFEHLHFSKAIGREPGGEECEILRLMQRLIVEAGWEPFDQDVIDMVDMNNSLYARAPTGWCAVSQ